MFKMRSVIAALALAGLVPAASASLTSTLTFDDLQGEAPFSAPYKGWTFASGDYSLGSWFYSDVNIGVNPQTLQYESHQLYHSPLTSISTSAFDDQLNIYTCSSANPFSPNPGDLCASAAITSATGMLVNGAYFRSLNDGVRVAFELWFQGQVVATTAVATVNYDEEIFLSTGYTGLVDKIVVVGDQGYFALDDLSVSDVPAPATLALLFAGAGAMAALRRRKTAA